MRLKHLLLSLLALLESITANAIESGDWKFEIISESACTARLMRYYGRGDGIITTPKTITDPSTGKAYSVTEIGKPSPGTATYYIVFDGYDGPFDGEEGWTIIISEGVQTIHEMAFNCLEHGTIYLPASLTTIYDPFSSDVDTITIFVPLGFSLNLGLSNANIYTNPNITFYDDGVKELCVANWDTNGDGMLSKAEAAAVTSLGSVFKGNTTITSFNELQYFTGLTSISYDAFNKCSNLTSIIIPNGVTYIGDRAFSECSSLTSVTIPNSVESINWYAFNQCSSLISITIPESVTYIGNGVFQSCSSLTSVSIPNGVERIKENTFSNCSSLTSITIPNSVLYIEKWAFRKCSNLISIDIPNSVKDISEEAFRDCISLTSVIIPNSIKEINNLSFTGCSGLTSVTIPNSVTIIGAQAFEYCSSLTSITIPNSVYLIGSSAFSGCSGLTSVTIPNSMKYINSNAFWGCSSLRDVWCHAEDVPDSGGAFPTSVAESATLHVPTASLEAYRTTAPWSQFGTIVAIDDTPIITFADANVKALCVANWDTNHDDELSEAEAAAVTNLGEVFSGNTTITSFDELQYFTGLTTIGDNAFDGCSSLTSIVIPNNVTTIGNNAFDGCTSLTSIAIPNNVTTIGDKAFDNCTNLVSVYMPDNIITFAGSFAFGDNNNIESVYITNLATWLGTSFNNGNNPLRSGAKLYLNNVEVKDLVIPEGTTAILKAAFEGCESLTSVSIPNSVTSIDGWAFAKCNNLTSATIPESVTSIGDHLFAYCSSLTSVTIPSSVTFIGNYAFADCGCLTGISVPNSVTSIGEGAFWGCAVATNINIPENLTIIEPYVFFNCPSLTSFTIPNGVTNVGELAFEWCNMTDVYCYAENVPNTNSNAFENSSISTATLHVPAASLEAYRTTAPWSSFGSIRAIEVEYVTNLLSNKWSGAEYSVQAATFDSGVNYGDWNDSNPNYNQIVGVPEADANGRNWYDVDYTCNWQEMTAPLNNWCQDGNFGDIYARRTFYYDEEMPEELFLACGHDDAPCEYYLNGELIWSVTDGWFEQEIYKLTSAQKALLRPGELNVLAFHVHQKYGGMYADCGLYTSLSEMGISNKCGDNLTWSFNGETGTLTISGTGDMYDFSDNSQTPWIGFKNSIKNIDVQSGATRIGGNAFNGCTALSSVTISNSVTVMGSWAFCDCKSLTSITIPEGVINIRENVFRNCTSLTSVSLPESLKTLAGHAFLGCRSLASITIPDGITFLDRIAFQECSSLTTLTYNKAENALTKVNGVYQIGTAEDLCNFAILSTAANTDICAQLTADIDYTGYTIPGGNVGEHFQHIGLNGYRGVFDGNGHTITVNINNPDSWQVAVLFRELGKGGVIKNLRVAGHVESVSKFSAGIVSNLKSGKVSHCVSDVDILSHIDGDCTDGGIAGIATYDGEESIVEYCVVAGSFQGSNAHHRGGIIGIGYGGISDNITIDNCLFLANVDGLDVTESGTFIRQPTDKTTINNCYYLNVLGTVTSGTQTTTAQVTSGELCFLLNGDQSNIDWTQNLTGDAVDSYPLPFSTHAQVYAYGNTYSNNDLSPIITFADPAVKAICVSTTTNWDTNHDGELSEAEAAAVTDLGEVFKGNTTITSFNELQYFTSLTTIGNNAFDGCSSLTSIVIPNNVTTIGNNAFDGCTSLTSIAIPNNVTTIGEYNQEIKGKTNVEIIPVSA